MFFTKNHRFLVPPDRTDGRTPLEDYAWQKQHYAWQKQHYAWQKQHYAWKKQQDDFRMTTFFRIRPPNLVCLKSRPVPRPTEAEWPKGPFPGCTGPIYENSRLNFHEKELFFTKNHDFPSGKNKK